MPILNYTTKIDVYRTIGEIQGTLVKHGARKILQEYDEKQRLSAISFVIGTRFGDVPIRMPANVDAVEKVLKRQRVNSDREQAERVAWRILKDWTEAQTAILESEMVRMEEIFLPYIVQKSGKTLFEILEEKQQLMLEGET